jgi:uncharacterized membrane protein YfcA
VTAEVALLLPIGVLIGTVMGLLGAGGSILTVPVLLALGGLDARSATTASLVVVGVSAAAGLIPHHRAGRVRLADGAGFAVPGVLGAAGGSIASRGLPDDLLVLAFAALLGTAAILMLARRDAGTPVPARGRVPRWQVWLTGLLVGVVTGVFGVGGGFVVVPALVLVLGFRMREAVGTSLLVILINAAAALVTRLGEAGVRWDVALPFVGATVIGVLLSSRLAHRVPAERLTTAFAVLLLVVAVATGVQAV